MVQKATCALHQWLLHEQSIHTIRDYIDKFTLVTYEVEIARKISFENVIFPASVQNVLKAQIEYTTNEKEGLKPTNKDHFNQLVYDPHWLSLASSPHIEKVNHIKKTLSFLNVFNHRT